MDEELTERDNPAFGLALAGFYAAVVIVFLGVARAGAVPVDSGAAAAITALGIDLGWTLAGVVALAISRTLMDRLLIARCCQSDEIVKNHNTASGAVEFGVYLSAAVVLAGTLREPGGSPLTAIVFFVLAQIVLLILGRVYQALAGYDVAAEIRSGNLAAGVALGLTLIAISLLMFKATSGEFVDWPTNLTFFAFDSIIGFALLLGFRWLVDAALLPSARIADEVARDRNTNVGLVEGVLSIGIAAIILVVF